MFEIPIVYNQNCRKYVLSLRLIHGYRLIYSYEYDGKYYIGQTGDLNNRHKGHRSHRNYIDNYIRAYDLTPTVIWIGKEESVDDAERHYIREYDSIYPNGYNFENGGCRQKSIHESTREKLRIAGTGAVFTEERKKRIGDAFRGRPNYGRRIQILQYDRMGYFIREWNGMIDI